MWEFAPADILGYERIYKDTEEYNRISFEKQDMNCGHIQEKLSKQDFLIYPVISICILEYIHNRSPYCYPTQLSNLYPGISFIIHVLYPGKLSTTISN
jgi:hypothetical protein